MPINAEYLDELFCDDKNKIREAAEKAGEAFDVLTKIFYDSGRTLREDEIELLDGMFELLKTYIEASPEEREGALQMFADDNQFSYQMANEIIEYFGLKI
jgi:hypothetical protein